MKPLHLALAVISLGLALPSAASADEPASYVTMRVVTPNGTTPYPTTANDLVTVTPRPFRFTSDNTDHPCDAGAGAVTPGSVLSAVANDSVRAYNFALEGTFDDATQTPTITAVDGQSVTPDPVSGKRLAEWINGLPATRGVCQDALRTGDRVLFAWGRGDERVLKIDLPSYDPCRSSNPLKVTDEATGAPVEGARVGDQVSDANGMVTGSTNGAVATKDGYIQSAPSRFAIPAIGCARPLPLPQPVAPGSQLGPAPAPAAKLTLSPASALRIGDLRFTAGSNRPVRATLTAKIGPLTIKRALVFSKPGRKTFKFPTNAPQKRALRRALATGPVRVVARISGNGTRATATGTLRRR